MLSSLLSYMEGILVTEKEGGQEANIFFYGVKLNEGFSM